MTMEDLYLSIINNLCDGVYYVDVNRKILFWNEAAAEITGYSAAEIVGKSCADTNLNHIDEDGRPLCVIGCPLYATIIDGAQRKACVFVRHKKGHRIPITVNIFPVKTGGKIVGAIEIFTQASPAVYDDKLVEHLSGIAMHDPLTAMPNRRYLESFLRYKFDTYRRFQQPFAVLFADIDDFGRFNNVYGHDAGDTVLANIAASVKKTVHKEDLVGRWGGEEFLGIYPIMQPYDAPVLAEKFRLLVANTEIVYGDVSLSVSVSVGVTVIRPEDTVESVVERADQYMYRSKSAGKNTVTTDNTAG